MPLDENIVSWNVTNWITVVAMVMLGFAAIAFAQSLWTARRSAPLAMAA